MSKIRIDIENFDINFASDFLLLFLSKEPTQSPFSIDHSNPFLSKYFIDNIFCCLCIFDTVVCPHHKYYSYGKLEIFTLITIFRLSLSKNSFKKIIYFYKFTKIISVHYDTYQLFLIHLDRLKS